MPDSIAAGASSSHGSWEAIYPSRIPASIRAIAEPGYYNMHFLRPAAMTKHHVDIPKFDFLLPLEPDAGSQIAC